MRLSQQLIEAMAVGKTSYSVKPPQGPQSEPWEVAREKTLSALRELRVGSEVMVLGRRYKVISVGKKSAKANDQFIVKGVKGARFSLTLPKTVEGAAWLLSNSTLKNKSVSLDKISVM